MTSPRQSPLSNATGPADLILKSGKVLTVDAGDSVVQAIAIKGDRVAATGTDAEVGPLIGPGTEVVDLRGRTVIPGIVDSHNHVSTAGAMMAGVMLFDARSFDDMRAKVVALAATKAPGSWIEGGGWIESQFAEDRMPTRWDLDPVSPDHPVVLDRLFGMSLVNSRALELAGITARTPDPPHGQIDRDPATGEPTGILRWRASSLVKNLVPRGDRGSALRRLEDCIRRATAEYVRWGITSVVDPGVSPFLARAYQNLRERGELPLRVNMMPQWYGLFGADEAEIEGRIDHLGIYTGFGDEWLRVGALKMAMDGGLGSRTALLNKPFLGDTDTWKPLRLDHTKLADYITVAQEAGWSVGIHCCGDRAQDMACAAFDEAQRRAPRPRGELRHQIIHGYFPTPYSLEVMRRLGIMVSVQPSFMYVEGDLYPRMVEVNRLPGFKPIRTYLENGIVVAANSDMTSAYFNPFEGLYAAVARKSRRGLSFGEREKVGRLEALRLFTLNGAFYTFEEKLKGSIEPGKLADLAVLSGDFLAVPEEEILRLTVDLTVVAGKVVWSRA